MGEAADEEKGRSQRSYARRGLCPKWVRPSTGGLGGMGGPDQGLIPAGAKGFLSSLVSFVAPHSPGHGRTHQRTAPAPSENAGAAVPDAWRTTSIGVRPRERSTIRNAPALTRGYVTPRGIA